MLYPSELQARGCFAAEATKTLPCCDSIADSTHAPAGPLALGVVLDLFGEFFDFFRLLEHGQGKYCRRIGFFHLGL